MVLIIWSGLNKFEFLKDNVTALSFNAVKSVENEWGKEDKSYLRVRLWRDREIEEIPRRNGKPQNRKLSVEIKRKNEIRAV